ncbi:nucleotide disphospho-sugar-binding domain-containing protein [Actinoplanes regularis]|uniref:nucleotide disphospho-sugar-binding domain-containing protein n=1 Tax=Actinoplanes regularis TaxID=52697 RepID=UPI0024A0D3F4|nr:nucleotide disphospho-sugar-binding domain-containing protein [Actinoplanes regularis]GLW33288.1 glycosyl transferase [Actinoplanes regularis]
MRVLFVSSPGAGHVFPLVPLAWGFRAVGHEVLVGACGESLEAADAGLPVVDIAPGFLVQDYLRQLFASDPGLPARDREAARRREISFAVTAFGPVNRRLADGLMRLARDWRPELVVYDELGVVGALAAAGLNVPGVHHNYGIVRTRSLWLGLQEALADLYDEYGLARPAEPAVTLDPAPPSMVSEPDGWPVRYVPYSGGAVLPGWLSERSRPRVAVALDTAIPGTEGPGPIRRIADAAAGMEAEFVLALGDESRAGLGDPPGNIRACEWLPMSALLPTCEAIVHHGTSDVALAAAVAGVPQLVLPFGKHHFVIADAIEKRGNGLAAEPGELDTPLLERLLSDERLRVAAHEVQDEIRALPSPAEIVQRLVDAA